MSLPIIVVPLAPLSGCVWQKMFRFVILHWIRSNIFNPVQYQLECLCPHYRSDSSCAESLPVKQNLFSGTLGPFDCLFFLLTIIHKVIYILNLNKQLLLREKMKISCGATFSRSAGYHGRSKSLSAYETDIVQATIMTVYFWTFFFGLLFRSVLLRFSDRGLVYQVEILRTK